MSELISVEESEIQFKELSNPGVADTRKIEEFLPNEEVPQEKREFPIAAFIPNGQSLVRSLYGYAIEKHEDGRWAWVIEDLGEKKRKVMTEMLIPYYAHTDTEREYVREFIKKNSTHLTLGTIREISGERLKEYITILKFQQQKNPRQRVVEGIIGDMTKDRTSQPMPGALSYDKMAEIGQKPQGVVLE